MNIKHFILGFAVAIALTLLPSCATTDGQNSFESAKFSGKVFGVRSTITIGDSVTKADDNK